MSAPACESRWQCTLNGVGGTAVILSILILGWVVVDLFSLNHPMRRMGQVVWMLFVPFGPTMMSVTYAALMRIQGRRLGWFGLCFVIGGATWGVIMLNVMRHL